MTEVYSISEYRDSVAHGSDFLATVLDDLQVIYDPEQFLTHEAPAGDR